MGDDQRVRLVPRSGGGAPGVGLRVGVESAQYTFLHTAPLYVCLFVCLCVCPHFFKAPTGYPKKRLTDLSTYVLCFMIYLMSYDLCLTLCLMTYVLCLI